MDTYRETQRETNGRMKGCKLDEAARRPPVFTYLQCDVGLGPVLEVGQQQVGVSVHKVDADQLLAARAPELRGTLTEGPPPALHARRVVLTVGQLAQRQRRGGDLTKLTTADGVR